jgi:hypothetical protein
MRKYPRDIVIFPDADAKPVVWYIRIGGEAFAETFPSLEEAKGAAIDWLAGRSQMVAEVGGDL